MTIQLSAVLRLLSCAEPGGSTDNEPHDIGGALVHVRRLDVPGLAGDKAKVEEGALTPLHQIAAGDALSLKFARVQSAQRCPPTGCSHANAPIRNRPREVTTRATPGLVKICSPST